MLIEFIDAVLEVIGFLMLQSSTDELILGLLAGNIGLCWLVVTD